MLDSRNSEWLSRLQSNGPNLVSLLLAALIAVELARVAVALVSGPVKSPEPTIAMNAQAHRPQGANAQAVASAHLFGVAVADPTTQDPNNAPLSSANLVLAGTIATENPKKGIAIISDGGPSKVFSVGQGVNGASLYSVYLDHVVLDRGGTLETLKLPRLIAANQSLRRGGGPGNNPAVENIRRMVQEDPGLLDQVMRTVASYDPTAGKLRGFRAYPGRNRTIFNKLGLKAGDLVTAINGQPLDDPQHSQEVLNTIQSSNSVTVTIERGGQKQDISLNVAEIATEASRDLEGDSSSAAPNANPGFNAGPSGAAAAPSGHPQPPGSSSPQPPNENNE
jgi:general secretion pathway protein C